MQTLVQLTHLTLLVNIHYQEIKDHLIVSHKPTQESIYSIVNGTQVVLGLTKLVFKSECNLDVNVWEATRASHLVSADKFYSYNDNP